MPSIFVFSLTYISLCRIAFAILQKSCQENFGTFQRSGESRFGGSEKDHYFLKIYKWQHKLARYYNRGKLISYFLNNGAKRCLYGLKISENIEIGYFFPSRAFFHFSSNLHTICFSALKGNAKFKGKPKCGLKSDIRNLVSFPASWQKPENLHFDRILLPKAYKDLDEKTQKSYVS